MTTFHTKHRTDFRISHGKITLVFYNKPAFCGGTCVYCIHEAGFTKSTVSNEDTLLAKNCSWDPTCQIDTRFQQYQIPAIYGYKYGLAVKGDSFTNHDPDYLRWYFKALYDYLNGHVSENLEEARFLQQDAFSRCVGVQAETRPDQITEEWCAIMLQLGVTTVELGVQCLDDEVLHINRRGHGLDEVRKATQLLREHGFEVGYHMMVGMVGSSDEIDYEVLSQRLWEPDFSPDCMKIYPCILLKNLKLQRQLARYANSTRWTPLTDERYVDLLTMAYPHIPPTVHVNRIQRMMPPEEILLGPKNTIDRLQFNGISRCLWQRSVAQTDYPLDGDFWDYRVQSSLHGTGYCIEATLQDGAVLVGYGRLNVIGGTNGLIRDLRVLGNMVPVGVRNHIGPQHIGIGKTMLQEMERLARQNGCTTLTVHPPVGTPRYFESLGFKPKGNYYYQKLLEPLFPRDA